MLKINPLTENAILPERKSKTAAGFDLFSAYDYTIKPVYEYGSTLVKTDISVELPENSYGRIAPRSGLAYNHCIDIGAGVIDEDYNSGIMVAWDLPDKPLPLGYSMYDNKSIIITGILRDGFDKITELQYLDKI